MPQQTAAASGRLLSPAIWNIGIALGCNLAWVLMAFQSMGLFHGFSNPETILDQTYLISISTTVVTLTLVGIFHQPLRSILGTTAARMIIPAGMAVSTLIIVGNGAQGLIGQVCILISGVGTGVFSGLFLMNFGIVLSLLSLRQSVAAVAIGYVASTVLFFVFLFFAPLEATLCCASMGPIAAVFLSYGVKSLGLRKEIVADPLPPQTMPSDQAERKELKDLTIAFSACMLAAGCAYELSRTLYVQMGAYASSAVTNYAIMQGGATAMVSLGSIALSLLFITAKGSRGPQLCYRVTTFFLMLGVLLLPIPVIFPELPAYLPLSINVASFQCLGMLMWILTTGLCRRYFSTSLRTFAFIRAAWSSGPLIGLLMGRMLWYNAGPDLQPIFAACVLCVILVSLVSSFVLTENVLARALNLMPTERKKHFQDKCRAVIERCGLTEREGEIMIMFAKGRNLPFVQEELYLSKSTVSTHRQHIYQKLNVHSSQEMIDLIQKERT